MAKKKSKQAVQPKLDAEGVAAKFSSLEVRDDGAAVVKPHEPPLAEERAAERKAKGQARKVITETPPEEPPVVVKPTVEVGKTYKGTDGKEYKVLSTNDAGVVTLCGKKKIPFPYPMFEVLVGLMSEDDYSKMKEEKRLARKAKAEADESKEHRKSSMWIIRTTLANNLDATLEEVSKACREAGVPKSDSTIKTIMSDFKQTYQALFDADRIVLD